MNRAGQGFAVGERKFDPRDDPRGARTIAALVRTRDLRPILAPVLADDDTRVALRLKVGRRRALMQGQVRRIARIGGSCAAFIPALNKRLSFVAKDSWRGSPAM